VVGCTIARRRDRSVDFSYVVARPRWNQGYATEIARTLLERARQDRALVQVWAVCDAANVASRRVLEKAGMKFDKTLPKHQRHNVAAEPRDCIRYTAAVETDGSNNGLQPTGFAGG
jgi:RimJ/RimL family protein N-acetyltransferase